MASRRHERIGSAVHLISAATPAPHIDSARGSAASPLSVAGGRQLVGGGDQSQVDLRSGHAGDRADHATGDDLLADGALTGTPLARRIDCARSRFGRLQSKPIRAARLVVVRAEQLCDWLTPESDHLAAARGVCIGAALGLLGWIALGLGLIALAGCSAPREQLGCLSRELARSGAPESVIAMAGPCDE
jgi:hypothetical protein